MLEYVSISFLESCSWCLCTFKQIIIHINNAGRLIDGMYSKDKGKVPVWSILFVCLKHIICLGWSSCIKEDTCANLFSLFLLFINSSCMSGIKKRSLSHTNCIKPTCTSCSNLLLLEHWRYGIYYGIHKLAYPLHCQKS